MAGRRLIVGASSLLLLALAACGGNDTSKTYQDTDQTPPPPTIQLFFAEQDVIPAGDQVTLRWRTNHADATTLEDQAGNALPTTGTVEEGSATVQPNATTTYTLSASAGSGDPAWRTVTVTVIPPVSPPPAITSFTASAELVPAGAPVVLSWTTTDATELTLKDDAGGEIPLPAGSVASGQVTVQPNRSPTTYALTATGPGGRADRSVVVDVSGLPRVTRFDVDPITPVTVGGSITLRWDTLHAASVVVLQDGTPIVEADEPSGSRVIVLQDSTTFAIDAIGPGGTAHATTLAQVGPRIVSFTASQRVVRAGDPVELAWELEDADRAVLDGPGGFHLALTGPQLASGTATVNVAELGDFVLQAFREDVGRKGSVAVDVTTAPRVRNLSVDRSVVTAAADHPATVVLTWEQDGADSCTIYRDNVAVAEFTAFPCDRVGSASVQVFGTSTLRFEAANGSGTHSALVDVQGVPPARIPVFTSTPDRRLSPGSTVTLSWEVTDAVSISMEKNGAPFAIGATAFTGTATDPANLDSTYILTAVNSLGDATVAEEKVQVGPPVILTAGADPAFVGIGAAVLLYWTADGGETLTVTDWNGTELFRTTDPAVIDEGSTTVLVPTTAGTYTYTVTDTNAAGASDTRTITVTSSDGPMIRSFTTNKVQISLGETVTLSWDVANDPGNRTPTLGLTDNYGHTHDLTGKNPNLGSVTIRPTEEGQHVYTLAADTGGGRIVAHADLTVEVTVAPIIVSFTANPDLLSTQGGTVVPQTTLTWRTQNGVEVSLFEADSAGNVHPPAFYKVSLAAQDPQSLLDAGSHTLGLTQTTWYVLRVKNRVGSFIDRRLKVTVDPPEVLTFTATPDQMLAGGTSVLSWTTRYATSASIDPPLGPLTATELFEPFVDVSTNGTLSPLSGDDSNVTVPFPDGFTFPFEGVARNAIQVSTNGWAGFNLTNSSAPYGSSTFPNSSRYVNFALLWCDHGTVSGPPASELWYGMAHDNQGDFFVVEWKSWSYLSSSYNPSNLNFELILRPSGLFEYRYGSMEAATTGRTAGEGCGIGYQYPSSSGYGGNLVTNGTAVTGGLANRTFRFAGTQAPNGSVTLTPQNTSVYTLAALSADGSAWAQTSIRVWKTPAVSAVRTVPAAPEANRPFRIEWTATDATQVRVLDDNGVEICRETDPVKVLSGFCTYTDPVAGAKHYTLEVSNGPLNAFVSVINRPFYFTLFPLLSIDSFTVTPGAFVHTNDQVTLTWLASGATEMQLFACTPHAGHAQAACTEITPVNANPQSGSITRTMTGSVDFWLRVYDVQYRVREATIEVWVDIPQIDSFTASSTQLSPGAGTTLTWNTTGAASVSVAGLPYQPPFEVTSTAPFLDVSTTGGTPVTPVGGTDSASYDVPFPAGFSFPWFGSLKTALRATSDGWLTFDTTYSSFHYNEATFPTSSYPAVHIAPFWDDLQHANVPLYYKVETGTNGIRYLVVQWKGMQLYGNTGTDLNFEVVFFENGDFDFRYGTMSPASNTDTAGDSASIGFQNADRTVARTLNGNAGDVMPGGLQGRSWRFPFAMAVDSSANVTPTDSTTYRLCAKNASLYDVCQDLRVVVVKPGDIFLSELMIAPATDNAEWFEVRNTAVDPIDLAGWTFASGATETAAVPATPPLVLQPGDFAVFARSADAAVNGGVSPDVVYGNTLTLGDAADDLRLYMGGSLVDSVTWGGTGWTIPAGASIAVEPSLMTRSATVNDAAAAWCASTAIYGGTFAGSPGAIGAGCLIADANQWYLADPVSGMPFIDISTTGTDDSSFLASTYYTAAIPLGFTMPYFGDTVSSMQIAKHGYITLAPASGVWPSNAAFPASGNPNGTVAPFWDELFTVAGTSKLYHRATTVAGANVMIVQWNKVSPGATSYGTLDFQIQLWERGDIVFVYRNVNRADASYAYTYGTSATIGMENLAGTLALQFSHGTSSTGTGPIYSGRSYMFHRR